MAAREGPMVLGVAIHPFDATRQVGVVAAL
jgi:hypothetical protein